MKFFISYSRSLKTEVGAVIKLLRAAGHEVWWDGDIPTIADWWATILKNIESCEVFVFMVSEKSAQSLYCLEELRYANRRNRPVLPFILDDHTRYTVPPELGRRQWFVHDGDPVNMLQHIIQDSNQIQWGEHRDRSVPRPPEPGSGSGTLTEQFQQAVNLAEAGQFEEARKRFNNVASLDYGEWGEDCQRWVVRLERYAEIAQLADHKATFDRARRKWQALLQDDPEAANFDPLGVGVRLASPAPLNAVSAVGGTSPAPTWSASPNNPAVVGTTPASSAPWPVNLTPPPVGVRKSRVPEILPAPFAWVDIPGKGYSIAKYPVTNAQFAPFIQAGGYTTQKWWTADGWQTRESEQWTEPRYWADANFNGAEQPVVGVSWYESVAYCLWLSDGTGEKIMLPTEDQWQYAAQGDDKRAYPWGDQWDGTRCNHNVGDKGIGKTTPVRQYEGKGDSPFGVVDMAGNVLEWCLTDYFNKTNGINMSAEYRVLRGGSWNNNHTDDFRCDVRSWGGPLNWNFNRGFRCCALS